MTATTINIGLPYITNADAAGKAFGIEGAGGGDQRAQWKIILDDLNANRKGILGRKVMPVYHPTDATSTQSYDAQEQEACSTYHEDNKVLAVLAPSQNDVLRACTSKAGAVQTDENLSFASQSTFQKFAHYVEVGNLRTDRMAAAWPAALQAQKYFTPWDIQAGGPSKAAPVKIGILTFDDERTAGAVKNVLIPGLAAIGLRSVVPIYTTTPRSSADNGATVSAFQAAVLKFRQEGVTHFLPFDPTGAVALFFAQNADSQKYYPRYALTSSNGAQLLLDIGVFPKKQLVGALGYGWVPLIDLSPANNPDGGPDSNASRRACLTLMKSKGQNLVGAVQQRSAIQLCDQVNFLKATLEAGGAANRDSFLAGVNRLGGSFVAGNTFATSFSAKQHDGVSTIRNFAYLGNCECFRYTGPRTRIS